MTPRDQRLQEAIRLYNELARIRKEAKATAQCERGPLEARAKAVGSQLRALLRLETATP